MGNIAWSRRRNRWGSLAAALVGLLASSSAEAIPVSAIFSVDGPPPVVVGTLVVRIVFDPDLLAPVEVPGRPDELVAQPLSFPGLVLATQVADEAADLVGVFATGVDGGGDLMELAFETLASGQGPGIVDFEIREISDLNGNPIPSDGWPSISVRLVPEPGSALLLLAGLGLLGTARPGRLPHPRTGFAP